MLIFLEQNILLIELDDSLSLLQIPLRTKRQAYEFERRSIWLLRNCLRRAQLTLTLKRFICPFRFIRFECETHWFSFTDILYRDSSWISTELCRFELWRRQWMKLSLFLSLDRSRSHSARHFIERTQHCFKSKSMICVFSMYKWKTLLYFYSFQLVFLGSFQQTSSYLLVARAFSNFSFDFLHHRRRQSTLFHQAFWYTFLAVNKHPSGA